MKLITSEVFLTWAAQQGIAPDDRYAEPRCLVYISDARESRFWAFDRDDRWLFERFGWMLAGSAPWLSCYVWPRGGVWQGDDRPRDRLEEIRASVGTGPLVPHGFLGAVRYDAGERDFLLGRLVRRARAALGVADDLFVVPEHGQLILALDHHDVAHVECVQPQRLHAFIEHMERGGYRLPKEPPDWTFKKPDWMA